MSEITFIVDQICNNPFCLYTFYVRYFWWIWEGTNVCDYFGRDIYFGAAILKLFLISPFIGATIFFPVWLYLYLIGWCGEVYANCAPFPDGFRLKDKKLGSRPSDRGCVEIKKLKAVKEQHEMYGKTLWEKISFWDRKNWKIPLRDKKGNIVHYENGDVVYRDGLWYDSKDIEKFLRYSTGNYVLDDDGDLICINHMFYHEYGDKNMVFQVKPEYEKFKQYIGQYNQYTRD